jgi:hypothetical protein
MAREVIVKPLGLVTRPNLYGQYPVGGLVAAQNLVMRSPGILETAPATVPGIAFGAANDVVHQLFALDAGSMFSVSRTGAGVWAPRVDAVTCHEISAAATWSQTGRIGAVRVRERLVANTANQGLKVIDLPTITSPAELRDAGFSQPAMPFLTAFPTGQAIAVNACAGYAAVFRREYADGYVLISKPSVIAVFFNNGLVPANPTFDIRISSTATPYGYEGLAVGDYVELYRTAVVSQATTSTDPGTTLGLIASIKLTAALQAAGVVTFVDDSLPGPLGATTGRALYTNPGQEGLLGGNRIPEICQCLAVFKQYAFQGNITGRPQITFQVPAGISSSTSTGFTTAAWRAAGIGTRESLSGTVTNGSATITAIAAADIVGIVPGQALFALGTGVFPAGAAVQSVGATTVVSTLAATAGGTGFYTHDRIAIAGLTSNIVVSPQAWIKLLSGAASFNPFEITSSENFLGTSDPSAGILSPTVTFQPFRPSQFFVSTFDIKATNGQNYAPELPEWASGAVVVPAPTYKNLLKWSKQSQPEHWPAPNETFVGAGEIIALESTRDALWIFCTDGLYRLSGDGGQWRIDTVDTTCILSSPRASCVLRETVYAYTNQGFVRITDAGVEQLSERIVGDLLPGAEYTETTSIILERNEAEDEIVIRLDASQVYVYSTRENAYTTLIVPDITAMAYVRYPLSGNAALAFGRSPSGAQPRYDLWNSTGNWLAAIARFQPVFAQDPFAAKQWIDASFVFDVGSIGKSLTPAWNATGSPSAALKGGSQYVTESRAVFGVPRRAAVGNTLAPGYSLAALGSSTKLFAISLRYRQFGEQQLHR